MKSPIDIECRGVSVKWNGVQVTSTSQRDRNGLEGTCCGRQSLVSLVRNSRGNEGILLHVSHRRAEAIGGLSREPERLRIGCTQAQRAVVLAGSGRTLVWREGSEAGVRRSIVLVRVGVASG